MATLENDVSREDHVQVLNKVRVIMAEDATAAVIPIEILEYNIFFPPKKKKKKKKTKSQNHKPRIGWGGSVAPADKRGVMMVMVEEKNEDQTKTVKRRNRTTSRKKVSSKALIMLFVFLVFVLS
jgi:hypothetical protein